MPLGDQHAWELLRALDDPDHMEFPRGYDHTAARARFDHLATRLDQRFQCTCTVDRGVQDASHHGTIVIPDAATASGEHIIVTISNFGNLATLALGSPGSHDEEEAEEREPCRNTDRHRVAEELEALGYIPISEHLLGTRYDGVSDLVSYYPPEHPPTWRTRFFDYL
ncbi:hypothetical protein O1L44_04815 [Streptomyces noursei]|uniref:hypothetical protein n=1 Tax=Streptomyces noursei TaxID=1971 RepID=UPI00081CE7D6|nr:hypothetical protein SNOUR_09790 [Streptomyces noursei ATCC 11455]MCZ0992582.1 hypothetical protein [Streptomyces noursei]